MLKENPNIEGIIPGKGNQVKSKPTTKDKGSTHLHSEPIKAFNHSSTTRISAPMWKRLDVPLDLCAIEDRIYIREFMLRFGKAMVPAINRNHLRELESIGGGFRGRDEFESWVSESCIKSMILGLLGFLVSELPNPEVFNEAPWNVYDVDTHTGDQVIYEENSSNRCILKQVMGSATNTSRYSRANYRL